MFTMFSNEGRDSLLLSIFWNLIALMVLLKGPFKIAISGIVVKIDSPGIHSVIV